MNTEGFYKLDNNELLYAPNAVINEDYVLLKDSHNEYQYPVDGWKWFDSKADACLEFNFVDPDTEETPLAE